MTASTKQRLSSKYREAMDQVSDIDDDLACDIDDFVNWLCQQLTNKRKMVQVLRAEIDELGGDGSEHRFQGQFHQSPEVSGSTGQESSTLNPTGDES